jgi:small-conductance mechanosensitive channel
MLIEIINHALRDPLIQKLISILSYILIILLAAVIFSDQLGGITVALGVAGAGIAFALQEVIISVAGSNLW